MSAIAASVVMPKKWRHPLKYTKTLGISLLFGHIGVLTVVAIYFIAFQSSAFNWIPSILGSHRSVKYYWDTLGSTQTHLLSTAHWVYFRHLTRNVGEYFLGIMLAQQIVFNPFKQKLTAPKWFDKVEIFLHIPNKYQEQVKGKGLSVKQLIATPALAFFVYAIPGYVLGYGVIQGIHHILHVHQIAPTLSAAPSLVNKLYSAAFDQHVIGVIAGFIMGRRVTKPTFAFTQRYFATRRVAMGKKARFWHPLPFQILVNRIEASSGKEGALKIQNAHSRLVPILMSGGFAVLIGLAIYGGYILNHYAS